MRLLVVSTSYPNHAGHGSGTYVHEQTRSMAALGHDVTVICPHAPGLALVEMIDGVRVQRFRYAPAGLERLAYGGGIPANLKASPWLWSAVPAFVAAMAARIRAAAQFVDLIHTHWTAAGLAAVMSGTRVPLVASFHGSDLMTDGAAMRRAARLVAGRARFVLVHGGEMAERAARLTPGLRIVTLPHGVDTVAITPLEITQRGEDIVCVGRLSREKGQDVLLDAFARVTAINARLRFVGAGPTVSELREKARALGIESRVEFCGELAHADTISAIRRAQIAVIPSRREGFSLACLEAMAAGAAIVATRCGGPEELLDHGRCGRLVAVDDAAAMAGAITELQIDEAARTNLGGAARERAVSVYDRSLIASALERLYRDTLGEGGNSPT